MIIPEIRIYNYQSKILLKYFKSVFWYMYIRNTLGKTATTKHVHSWEVSKWGSTHSMVLVGCNCHELCLWENECFIILCFGAVFYLRVHIHHVEPGLEFVHRVEDYLKWDEYTVVTGIFTIETNSQSAHNLSY